MLRRIPANDFNRREKLKREFYAQRIQNVWRKSLGKSWSTRKQDKIDNREGPDDSIANWHHETLCKYLESNLSEKYHKNSVEKTFVEIC